MQLEEKLKLMKRKIKNISEERLLYGDFAVLQYILDNKSSVEEKYNNMAEDFFNFDIFIFKFS